MNPYDSIFQLRNITERLISQLADTEEQLEQYAWTDVNDRLPEIPDGSYSSDIVLCYSSITERLYFSKFVENGFGTRGFDVTRYDDDAHITHWMNIPPLPDKTYNKKTKKFPCIYTE